MTVFACPSTVKVLLVLMVLVLAKQLTLGLLYPYCLLWVPAAARA
jgi:hypothetical protein